MDENLEVVNCKALHGKKLQLRKVRHFQDLAGCREGMRTEACIGVAGLGGLQSE